MSVTSNPELVRRAALHAALGDPHRLAICDALSLCDRAPMELGVLLEMPSNLLAHHLRVLTRAGIVEVAGSSGDRRRRYVRLRRGGMVDGPVRAVLAADSVLFVCTGNAARSQLAAALWRAVSPIAADSAGTHPADAVHPLALRIAAAHKLDLSEARPRVIAETDGSPGLLVTVCDQAHEELRLTGPTMQLHWSVPDPVPVASMRAFEAVYEELRERVGALAAVIRASDAA